MKSTFLLAILLLWLPRLAREAHAACGQGKPPRYFNSLVWAGNGALGGEKGAFDGTVRKATDDLGAHSHKLYLALGGTLAEDGKFTPGWRPETPEKNTNIVEASGSGLMEIAKSVSADFENLKKNDHAFVPSDYQLTVFVTNHGTESVGKAGKHYGIAASPLAKTTKWSQGGAPYIDQEELTAFAKGLPHGIRIKTVFAECFGSDTQKAFLDAFPDDDRKCRCGVASATLGRVSYAKHQVQNDEWADSAIDVLDKGGSLLSVQLSTFQGFFDDSQLNDPAVSTSQNLIYDYFMRHSADFGLSHNPTVMDLDTAAKKILKSAIASSAKLPPEDQKLLDALLLERVRAFGWPWLTASLLKRADEVADLSLPYEKKENLYKKVDVLKLGSDSPAFLRLHEIQASRQRLLEAFLRLADAKEKQHFRDLLSCEQDPMLPSAPADDGSSGTSCTVPQNMLEGDAKKALGI